MQPYWFSVVGLILGICGGFLVAVEGAIEEGGARTAAASGLSGGTTAG